MPLGEDLKQLPQEHQGPLVKLGKGDLGGKARGLSFLESLIEMYGLKAEFSPHRIAVPETVVLASGEYDRFLQLNDLGDLLGRPDEEIRGRFLEGAFPPETERALARYLRGHKRPIAVRSSSLNEDAYNHPAAGLYMTLMLANNAESEEARLKQLCDAVRLVYASTICMAPVAYMRRHNLPVENEKMAIVLQEVVGGPAHSEVYYPLCAGAAQSLNYFPVGRMKPRDGVVALVFGLGKRAVDGMDALRFSPRHPLVRPQFGTPQDTLKNSQKGFYAVDLNSGSKDLTGSEMDTLLELKVEAAEGHGTLAELASTWVMEDGTLYDGLSRDGRRVLTFDRLLKGILFPFPRIIGRVLSLAEEGFGSPVEIEFAATVEGEGLERRGILHLLQARPLAAAAAGGRVRIPEIADERRVLDCARALGHGSLDGIRDLVWVDPAGFDPTRTHEMARAVGRLNEALESRQRRYLLLVPGRLGSTNPRLGLPVKYPQVGGAALLAELATDEFRAEPSQGTHFFHNVVAGGLFYLFADLTGEDHLALEWLRALPRETEEGGVIHSVADEELSIRVDAALPRAVVYRPEPG